MTCMTSARALLIFTFLITATRPLQADEHPDMATRAHRLRDAGIGLTAAGIVLSWVSGALVAAAIGNDVGEHSLNTPPGILPASIALAGGAVASVLVGVPLWVIGGRRHAARSKQQFTLDSHSVGVRF
jgi:hypothetical protein